MNAQRLLQHFDRIAEAPDAVPRLRRFILDLAVRGKLVEQDPADEPASQLLKRITADKARLMKAGEIRRQNALRSLSDAETAFELPPGWEWVRLGNLSKLVTSGSRDWAKHYSSEGAIFVRMGNLSKDHYRLRLGFVQRVTPPPGGEGTRTRLEGGDILISITGEVGMLGLIPEGFGEAYINQHTAMVRPMPEMKNRYLAELFRSPFAQDQFNEPQRGIKNSFRLTDVTQFVVPLPPLPEQHRIVAKVDELMALCDQLDAAQNQREQRRDRLVTASLRQLQDEEGLTRRHEGTKEEGANENNLCAFAPLRESVFLRDIPRLTTRPEHIKSLRQTILNLAVRGRLVPQYSCDEPASDLLRSGMAAARPSDRFELPPTWLWATVSEIAETRLGKMLDKAKNKGRPRRYLRGINVRWFDFDLTDVLEMRFEDCELEEFALASGDVLICEGGESGRAAVWDEREKEIYFQKAIHRVRFPKGINPHYFVNVLREAVDSGRLEKYCNGVTIKHLTGRGLSSLPVPLPPLEEQHRIVAKVDELMAVCDQLEAQISTTNNDSRRLLEAVLREALA